MSTKDKALAVYQIIGAIWGLYLLMINAFSSSLNKSQATIAFIFIVLYLLSLFSGYLLLTQKDYAFKVILGLLILQIVQIQIENFGFAFVSGSYIGINVANEISYFFQPIYAYFLLSFEEQSMNVVSINISPILIMILYFNRLLGWATKRGDTNLNEPSL